MVLLKYIILVVILSCGFSFFKAIRLRFMKYYYRLSETIRKMYRLLNVRNRSEIVWKELIKAHQEKGWNFGQYDKEKYIQTVFTVNGNIGIKFTSEVGNNKLEFKALILDSFDEERTTDILVLASHFNGLLNFGKVNVSTKYNYVELVYSGDLITYMLYPGEIHSDQMVHYDLTKDCCWAFYNLIETGEDPVFVISELLRRHEEENKTNN